MNRILKISRTRTDYALVLLMICVSGNPLFTDGRFDEAVLVTTAALAAAVLIRRRRLAITPASVGVVLALTLILLVQGMLFAFLPVVTTGGFLIRLFIAYATVRAVNRFPKVLVRVMCFLAVLSLCFYLIDTALSLGGVSMRNWFSPPAVKRLCLIRYHIILHNFNFSEDSLPYRNAGLMWEPAAFAGYLLMAMILLGLDGEQAAHRRYKWALVLLTLCVVTTQSTMAYLVLPFALGLHAALWARRRHRLRPWPAAIGAVVLAAGVYLTWQVDFVGRKTTKHYSQAVMKQRGWEINRFGSMLYDLEYIRRRPWMGWGIHKKTRRALNPGTEVDQSQGNGLSDFIAKFGFVGLMVFLWSVWRGLSGLSVRGGLPAAFAVVLLVVMLNGETFLNHPLFLSLMFLSEHRASRTLPRPAAAAAVVPVAHVVPNAGWY